MVRRSCVFGLLAAVLCAAALIAAGRAQAAAPTVVSLGFDDGYTSQYGVRSMLASHGMHGTFFIISGFVGTGEFMSWSQVAGLAADGNEIGGHTVGHLDLTTVSAAEARHQICDDRTALLAHGLQITSFAYPYGTSNGQVEQIAEDCGYDSARTTGWFGPDCPSPCTESIPPRNPFATSVVGFSDQTNAELQAVVTNAEATGGWAQIVIHGVCDSGCAITATRLNAFLDWLATRVTVGAVVVKTIHEVMSMPPPPPPPATSITAGPSGVTKHASPSFSFTSDAVTGVTFACRLDGPGAAPGPWGACTSPKAYASLADGSYTFRVRASNAGGTDQTPATRSFTVDATAPSAPVITSPADQSWNVSGTVVLGGTAEAGSTVEVFDGATSKGVATVDGLGSWSKTLTGVPDASHVYTGTASDDAGNTSAASAQLTVKVDTLAPAAPAISSPADDSWNATGTVALSGTAEAGSTVELFDGGASRGTATADPSGVWSKTLTGIADGSHVYTTKASDAAGNTSGASAPPRTVKVDTTVPDTSITTGPTGTSAATAATFTFTGEADPVSFECAGDGAPFAACSSPVTVSALTPGSHTFKVRAIDAAGNVDATPASRTWSVDPPALPPVMPPVVIPPGPAVDGPLGRPGLPVASPRLSGQRVARTTRRRLSLRFTTDQAGSARVSLVRCSGRTRDCRRYTVISRTTRRVTAGNASVGLKTPVLRAGSYRVRVMVRAVSGRDSRVAQVTFVVPE